MNQTGQMRTGRCQCGNVIFSCAEEALALFVCHCRECQKQSASAFGMSFQVPRASLTMLRGKPLYWSRPTDSGKRLDCAFCPDCGSRLWHGNPASTEETVTVKAGALDEPVDASNAIHIWVSRKLPGIVIPDTARQFAGEPPASPASESAASSAPQRQG